MIEMYGGDRIHRLADARCALKLHFLTNQQNFYLKSIRGSTSLFSDDPEGYGKSIHLEEYSHDSRVKTILVPHSHLNDLLAEHSDIAGAYHAAGSDLPPIEELIYSFITVCRQENYSLIVISFLEAVYGE